MPVIIGLTYMFCEAAKGGTPALLWAHFTEHMPLPPDEVFLNTYPGPHAVRLYQAGPIQQEPQPMPAEALDFMKERLTALLAAHPEGLTARNMALELRTERVFSDSALQALVSERKVVFTMQETHVGGTFSHYVTIYKLVA